MGLESGAGGRLLPEPALARWLSHDGSGKGLFVNFRLYGPLDPYSDKVWKPDGFRRSD